MKLTLHLLTCNEPSPYTGRVYPLEEVKKMVEKYNERNIDYPTVGVLVQETEEYCADMPLYHISHVTNSLYIDKTSLMANITLLLTHAGEVVKNNLDALRLSPAMSGNFNNMNCIHDLTLIRTDFLFKQEVPEGY